MDGVSFSRNAKALDLSGLQIGLHLNFTERLNPDRDPTMLYLPVSVLIARSYLRQLNETGVRRQIVRQLDRFEARSEEHTSELQSLMRISYAVFCLKKTNNP